MKRSATEESLEADNHTDGCVKGSLGYARDDNWKNMFKKILLIIASEGFRQEEYFETKKVLESVGFVVVTASDAMGKAVAKDGSLASVDLLVGDVNVADYDGIFFVGGPGALAHLDNEKSYQIANLSVNKPHGAICISPRILAHAGILKNKKVTGWDKDEELAGILDSVGAEYVKKSVVVDGNLITANGPEAAKEFGEAIVKLLKT